MAKVTLDTIVSGFKSVTTLISNFNTISGELNNKVLYRNNPVGEPNQMLNDLDMNSKDILNTNQVTTTNLSVAGQLILPSGLTAFSGTPTFSGDINTTEQYLVDSVQVVGNRVTGWAAPTGTATRTTFATSTVTTAQLAERVKALIDDLTTHGLIGT